ncbi:PrpF domain-containing protein [Brevibacterium pigmentatum]|uniref:PrpF domain-containing protein n=1 Tax=Brevibacterium pigmentatum TaxID=1496080 RepID=UPI0014203E00|nr:PrpF domain-containing protein [Brevibacterium pigmentatum]
MESQLHGQWYRGGTSKCWLFANDEMPADRAGIAQALSAAFGSGDERQLNGVGGASSTTSKAAVISPSAIPGIDISYLFAQVGIGQSAVEFTSNCGNCASAVALYAIQNGLVRPGGEITPVRMVNENTRSVVVAHVATPGRKIPANGSETIPGSSMPGIPVNVFFENVDGASTGELLPTGEAVTRLSFEDSTVSASCIDAGAPACFVNGAELGLSGAGMTAEIRLRLKELIAIRATASRSMGLSTDGEEPSPAIPKVGLIAPPSDYTSISGEKISAEDYDISARMVSMFDLHPAIGITSAIALARAAFVEGSLVNEAIDKRILQKTDAAEEVAFRIGTPVGVIVCRVQLTESGQVARLGVRRVARRIAHADIDLPLVS